MDKYEYKLKAEEIRTLAANKQYIEAMQIADAIDWRRVKSVMMLNVVSEIYKMNRRYEDSREILLLAYEHHPGGRSILYSLCELSIKMEEFVQAVEYYKEFVQAAPKDMGRYILQYKLYEAQEVGLEERIAVLEEFKKRDYREKWAYELAFLYHRIGLATKCVEECDELILWFGEGKYVTKAMELKMLHEPLTPAQLERYQKKSKKSQTDYEDDIQVKTVDVGKYNTINLQQELAASMQELMGYAEEETDEEEEETLAEAIIAPLLEETGRIETADVACAIERDSEEVFFEDDEDGNYDEGDEETYEEEEVNYDDKEDANYEDEREIIYEDSEEIIYADGEEVIYDNENKEEERGEKEPVFAKMLSQEYDGQISLVVPEKEQIEKQITGQIQIEDILLEWEKMKKENEEKRREDVRKRVLEQTSDLFSEFDASTKAGLLEDLNRLADAVEDNAEKTADTDEIEDIEDIEKSEEPEELSESEELAEIIAEEIIEAEEAEYYEEPIEGEAEYYEEPIEEDSEYYEEPIEGEAGYYEEPIEGETEYYEEPIEGETEYYEEPLESGHTLSKEQEKLFEAYLSSNKNREQIVDALDKISLASYTGNIIVSGDMGTGTMTLAKNLIKEVQLTDSNFSGKVAKVSGESLNKRNIGDTIARLKSGALLVEKAGGMTTRTLEDLEKALEKENDGIIVILEDTKREIEKLLDRYRRIEDKFNARIDVTELSNDALVAHGREYALETEYAIDELGVLALYTRIAELQTSEHAVNIREVEEIIDEAIHHVNKKNLSHFRDILFGKRYDEEDMIVLREKDFISY